MKYFDWKIKKSDLYLIIIIMVLILSFIYIKIFDHYSHLVMLKYSKNTATNYINGLITKALNENIYEFDDFISIGKNEEGLIEELNIDNKKINTLFNNISSSLLSSINYSNKNNNIYYIPLGIMYDIPVIANLGPKIPYKIDLNGNINNETFIKVEEYGINSFLIQLILRVNAELQVILPFRSETINIQKDLILDSKIIHGKVPNYYGGLIYDGNNN